MAVGWGPERKPDSSREGLWLWVPTLVALWPGPPRHRPSVVPAPSLPHQALTPGEGGCGRWLEGQDTGQTRPVTCGGAGSPGQGGLRGRRSDSGEGGPGPSGSRYPAETEAGKRRGGERAPEGTGGLGRGPPRGGRAGTWSGEGSGSLPGLGAECERPGAPHPTHVPDVLSEAWSEPSLTCWVSSEA